MFASVANRDANYGDRYYAANQKYFKKTLKKTVPGTDDVEPDTCNSVASQREEFASRFAGVRPQAADFKLFTAT